MPEPQPAYTPIDCGAYDRLLALATRRRESELTYSEGADLRRVRGIIVDVYSRDGAEYLDIADGPTLRLDQLREIDGEPIPEGHA